MAEVSPKAKLGYMHSHNSPSIVDFDQLEPERDDAIDLYATTPDDFGELEIDTPELQSSVADGMELDLSSLRFEDEDDPFAEKVDPNVFLSAARRPTTTLEDSDDSDEFDMDSYQDEGLRRQLRITLRRRLNYDSGLRRLENVTASGAGEMIVSASNEARRITMGGDFKILHQEVANRLSLEVFDSNVAMGSGARSHSVPGFGKRKSLGGSRLSLLPDSIKADEIGCNLLRHRRIRTTNSVFSSEIVDETSILNNLEALEMSFSKIDSLDIESVIEEESKRKRRLFKKRRRQTKEITESAPPPRVPNGPPTTLSHRSFVPDGDKKLSENYQLPIYAPNKENRVEITDLMPGDIVFIFDCVTTHSSEIDDRPASTVKHVMIITEKMYNCQVAHVTRSCSEQSFLKAWEDPETNRELMNRKSIFQIMSDVPENVKHWTAGYLGVAFRPSNPIVKMPDGETQDVGIVAGKIAADMIKTGRVIPTSSVIKDSCLSDAPEESFLLKNKYSFYRRNIRDIWDRGDVFLNLFPEDFVVLCYHRAIVKCCKRFDKELIRILDVDWRACNIHDLYNYLCSSDDWWSPGEVLFEFS